MALRADSRFGPWVNLNLGVQYTLYTQFNGGTSNYDGSGRAASDNNVLYVFAWLLIAGAAGLLIYPIYCGAGIQESMKSAVPAGVLLALFLIRMPVKQR